ncbi:hypothetical protein MAR_001722 [Mya arenaria]|uniref:Uncharacterized protein n=1 Tax=Mya arenaria TaxID=6604 RepID=A0ABY7FFE6_MYAAR|nr:hypothetical protein MAR_001722 [Mya arenaria]
MLPPHQKAGAGQMFLHLAYTKGLRVPFPLNGGLSKKFLFKGVNLLTEEVDVEILALQLFLKAFDLALKVVNVCGLVSNGVFLHLDKLFGASDQRIDGHIESQIQRDSSKGHVTDSASEMQTAITLAALWGIGILFVAKIWGGDHGLKHRPTNMSMSTHDPD